MNSTKTINRALGLFNTNKLADARKLLRNVTRVDQENVDGWTLLGMTEARLGAFVEAEKCFRRILLINPNSADARYYLGASLEGQRLYSGAIREYEETLKIQPDNIKALFNLGNIYRAKGLFIKAEEYYRGVLQLNPEHGGALNNLGSVLKTLFRLEEALQLFQKALLVTPADSGVLLNLGNTYHQLEDFSLAENYYLQAISINGELSEAYSGLCGVLCKQGRVPEALELLERARKLLPDNDGVVASQATIYEERGRYQEAYDVLKHRLNGEFGDVDIAICFGKIARHVGLEDEAASLLEKLLERDQTTVDKTNISYMLGALYDGLKQYNSAYDYYYKANQLEPSQLDRIELENKFDKLIFSFTKESLSMIPRSSIKTGKPVFVVGMPRSGTSLVEQILSSHSNIFGAGELIDVGKIATAIQVDEAIEDKYPACVRYISTEQLSEFSRQYVNKIDELAPDALRVIDKMPGNFVHLGLIELMFPNARIIHCVRDPLDNCLSCYSMKFMGYHPYAYDQEDLGFYYCQYLRLMKHWKEVIGLEMYTVQYETLVENQEKISRELIGFCGLDWEDDCLEFHKNKRLVKTASYDQVRRPMYKSAIHRSDPYREKLSVLVNELNKCNY